MLFSGIEFYCRSRGRPFNRKRLLSLPFMHRNVQYTSLRSVYDLFSQSNIQYDEAFSDIIFFDVNTVHLLYRNHQHIFIIISIIIQHLLVGRHRSRGEWLRRQTRNLPGFSRVGSNPTDYVN